MCKTLNISSGGYYNWESNPTTNRVKRDNELTDKIKAIHQSSRGIYGSPRITKELNMQGEKTSTKRVTRLMKESNIRSMRKIKYKATTNSKHQYSIADNVLDRSFSASRSAQKWVSDITYISTNQGWLYLTVIIDLYDRKVIGWSLSHILTTKQTITRAWLMAISNRPITNSLIFHSDRGVQYAANSFTNKLKQNSNVIQSMSRKGNCWDNAVAESFFKSIKVELIYRYKSMDRDVAKSLVFEYIEVFYNQNRRHYALDNLTIKEFNNFESLKHAA